MSSIFKKLTFGLKLKSNKAPAGPIIAKSAFNGGSHPVSPTKDNKKRKIELDDADDHERKRVKIDDDDDDDDDGQFKTKRVKKPLSLERLVQMNKEKIAHLRNENRIHVHGSDMPDPISSFDELASAHKFPEYILENLKEMGMKQPTPIQMQAITAILQDRNVMVCAPTGSGKTLAFSLPLVRELGAHESGGFRALVIAPTRELAKQIQSEMVQVAKGSSLKIKFLAKSATEEDRQKWKDSDIMITTPKKLVHASEKYPKDIHFTNVRYLVIDESDKLFEDGETGFRRQLAVLYKKCQSKSIRTLLFSATFSQELEEWCYGNLNNLLKVYIGAINSASRTIDQKLMYVGSEAGKIVALRNIFREGFSAPVLIFTQSKQRSEELHHELCNDGLSIEVIHSEKSVNQRDAIVRSFQKGQIWILICTDVMARGIDFKEVNLVINYDFPTSAVAYIHRIGRTGRADKYGKAITFFTDGDVTFLRSVVNLMRESGCEVPDYMLKIKKTRKKEMKEMAKKAPKRELISKEGAAAYKAKKRRPKRKTYKKTQKKEPVSEQAASDVKAKKSTKKPKPPGSNKKKSIQNNES